jgi:ribosome recycling factor
MSFMVGACNAHYQRMPIAGMLDHVRVEAYGEMQSLTGVAQIALKSPILLVVSPFDSAVRRCSAVSTYQDNGQMNLWSSVQLGPAIADAIRDAELNLNPSVDGNIVRVPVPKASKETKEATVKLISKIAENAKTRIRRVRQAAMDKLKKADGRRISQR